MSKQRNCRWCVLCTHPTGLHSLHDTRHHILGVSKVKTAEKYRTEEMSLNLNDAAMAGNVEEVLIRLNMGEDVNQKCYPR